MPLYRLLAFGAMSWLIATAGWGQSNGKVTMYVTAAQQYVTAFRSGEAFNRPAKGVTHDGQIDAEALALLSRELEGSAPEVREKIVGLLVDAAVQADPLTRSGAEALRDPQVIAVLAGPGLGRVDVGRDAALDALRKLATPRELARHGTRFVRSLEEAPTSDGFLLVAKAKPQGAQPLVTRLAQLPPHAGTEAARIALAALGAKDIESQFIAAVQAAADGPALARSVGPLGLIGTLRSLQVVALQLRTPLTIHQIGAFEKSVRLNVLEALYYNFPDQAVLYPNNILNPASYAAAEDFCIKTLGVQYTTPPPPFLTYRGYPIPMPRQ